MPHYRLVTFIALLILSPVIIAGENESYEKLDNYLKSAVDNGFSGAVLIVENNQLRLNQGYGLAQREKNLHNTPDTLFDIGSVTKQFTAAAIMHLVQEEKLSTAMTLAEFFENVPADKQAITIHQLLTHSAGIANGIGEGDFDHVPTPEFFTRLFAQALYFSPGDGYAYSNSGYSILARIIELVSGMPYEEYLQFAFFKPLGMNRTGYLKPGLETLPAATGYLYGEIDTGSTRDRYLKDKKIAWPLKGNGGIVSTLNDMYLWAKALQGDTVLTYSFREQLFQPHVAEDEAGNSHYGYGWAVMQTPRGSQFIGHNGSNGIYYFDFRWFPEEDSLILFATNAMVESTMALPVYIEQYLFEREPLPDFNRGLASDIVRWSLNSPAAFKEKKAQLAKTFAARIDDKRLLNRTGLMMMRQGYHEDALAMLSLNVELYEEDGNLWDSLGEVYYQSKQFSAAKHAFQQAIQRRPVQNCFWCDNSQQRLTDIAEAVSSVKSDHHQ